LSEDSCNFQAMVAADGEPDAISVRRWTIIESTSKDWPVSTESWFTAELPEIDWMPTELATTDETSTESYGFIRIRLCLVVPCRRRSGGCGERYRAAYYSL
jgi:hypothetical protein